jgi:ribosome-interacting GTPase 1
LPDYDPRDLKLRDVELQREKKWCKMLQEWHKYENTEKLHKRIYKGIPNSLRGRVWAQLLNVPKLQQEQKNKYEVGSSAIFVKRGNESVLQVLDVSSSGNENACTQVVARHPAD